ncbi:MAG: type I polyketide synthase, partial [Deltaproteobacteria bacterium]|nr:type I polyketide synthase [Deltaproteobacteria bacterium]
HRPRIAGVNSFGFGGANAHVVLEEAPAQKTLNSNGKTLLPFKLSARSEASLKKIAKSYLKKLEESSALSFEEICYESCVYREDFEFRVLQFCSNLQELKQFLITLSSDDASHPIQRVSISQGPKTVFLFTGQGSQYPQMGKELYESEPVFRKVLDEADLHWKKIKPGSPTLLSILFASDSATQSLIHQTANTQPLLFIFEYALAKFFESKGIRPHSVLGHSVGEYVAAVFAGVFSWQEALSLIAKRGELMQSLPLDGAMLAVTASESKLEPDLASYAQEVSIATLNTAENVVVSGKKTVLEKLAAQWEAKGLSTQWLQVSHAFHSPLMDPILKEFKQHAQTLTFQKPKIPLLSNVSGSFWSSQNIPDASYWTQHLRQAVRFADGIQSLLKEDYQIFLEIGPQAILTALGKRNDSDNKGRWISTLRKDKSDRTCLQESFRQLYFSGLSFDWKCFFPMGISRPALLPTYAFEPQRHWLEKIGPHAIQSRANSPLIHQTNLPLLEEVHLSSGAEKIFTQSLSLSTHPFLKDHVFGNEAIFPAAAYAEILFELGTFLKIDTPLQISDLEFKIGFFLSEAESLLQTLVTAESHQNYRVKILSYQDSQWNEHFEGSLQGLAQDFIFEERESILQGLNRLREKGELIDPTFFYEACQQQGLSYGPAFQGIQELRRYELEASAIIALPQPILLENENYVFHPALLDACFQVLGSLLTAQERGAYLPVRIRKLKIFKKIPSRLSLYVKREKTNSPLQEVSGSIYFLDEQQECFAILEGLELRPLEAPTSQLDLDLLKNNSYELNWKKL